MRYKKNNRIGSSATSSKKFSTVLRQPERGSSPGRSRFSGSRGGSPRRTGSFDAPKGDATLLVSFAIRPGASFSGVSASLFNLLSASRQKKIVVSCVDGVDPEILTGLEGNFKDYEDILFEHPSSNDVELSISRAHNEAFKKHSSGYFLIADSTASLKAKSLDKMLRFLAGTASDNSAVVPRCYYDGETFPNCRRFLSPWHLFSAPSDSNLKYKMLERGEAGYYLIHRVDWSFLNCMLVLSSKFKDAGGVPCMSSELLRSSLLCKKLYRGNCKISYFPHAYTELHNKPEERYTFGQFLTYWFSSLF